MTKRMAVLDGNLVVNLIVCKPDVPETATLLNTVDRCAVHIGYTYDEERDAFIPPKPFESWVLDESTCLWVAPVDMPDDGKEYSWDEDSTSWVEIVEAV